MDLVYVDNPQGIIVWGEFPPASDWDEHVAHRDRAARAIGYTMVCSACGHEAPCACRAGGKHGPNPPFVKHGGHPSNGFQYGVDISAGNVECGYLKPVGDSFLIVQQDPETGEVPDGALPATFCFYESWR